MKKLVVCLAMASFAACSLAADEPDVIARAQRDAAEDGRRTSGFWWGVGGVAVSVLPVVMTAFFADPLPVEARRLIAVAAPPIGGAGLALVGYLTGAADVPEERIEQIRGEWDDTGLQSLYATEYRKALTKIQRRKRGTGAMIGSGVSIGVMGIGFLVVYLSK